MKEINCENCTKHDICFPGESGADKSVLASTCLEYEEQSDE